MTGWNAISTVVYYSHAILVDRYVNKYRVFPWERPTERRYITWQREENLGANPRNNGVED